jgi:hypothetical protein
VFLSTFAHEEAIVPQMDANSKMLLRLRLAALPPAIIWLVLLRIPNEVGSVLPLATIFRRLRNQSQSERVFGTVVSW